MWLWNESIDVLRESMLAYAQLCNGNLGYGILIVTFMARLALLPLGLRLAKVAQAHQRAMQRIQPRNDAAPAGSKRWIARWTRTNVSCVRSSPSSPASAMHSASTGLR